MSPSRSVVKPEPVVVSVSSVEPDVDELLPAPVVGVGSLLLAGVSSPPTSTGAGSSASAGSTRPCS